VKTTTVITTRLGPQPMETVWAQGGLAVHSNYWGGEGGPVDEDGWTITQVSTGFAVRKDLEQDEAIALAEALLPCGDWTRDFAATVADNALYAAVRKVAAGRGWSLPSKRVSDRRRAAALAEFAA
jgi:hypothetical protein